MRIRDFLSRDCIKIELKNVEKKSHIKEMVEILSRAGKIQNSKISLLTDKLMEREAIGSTGIGGGVAIPHVKTEHVSSVTGALGVSEKGVDFDSLDGEPVYISFILLTSPESRNDHLKALAEISQFLKDKFYREEIKNAKNEKQVYKLIKRV